jgi:hypothetical protein
MNVWSSRRRLCDFSFNRGDGDNRGVESEKERLLGVLLVEDNGSTRFPLMGVAPSGP